MSNILRYHGLETDPTKLSESTTVKLPTSNQTILTESATGVKLMPRIEAIHAGTTRNFTHYPADKLRGDAASGTGVHSWLAPYPKPVIYNHDITTEATGRVKRAAFAEYTQAGRPGILVVPEITDEKAVQAIKDGRLLTVSIGATTDAAICSICGTDIANEGYCGHMKGETYDGRTAEWITGNVWFDELSWVNVPADSDAMIVDSETSLIPQASTEESVAGESLDTYKVFNVPKGTGIIEAYQTTESNSPSGREEEMTKEEKTQVEEEKDDVQQTEPETQDVEPKAPESPEEKPEAEPVEKPEDPKAEKPEGDEEKSSDESAENTDEENPQPESEDKKDSDEEETVATKEDAFDKGTEEALSSEVARLKSLNEALETQLESVTQELKGYVKEEILSNLSMEEEAKEAYSKRLDARPLDSLKENLEDIKAGFFTAPKSGKRKVEKVDNPVKTEESTGESTREDSIDEPKVTSELLKGLFGSKK